MSRRVSLKPDWDLVRRAADADNPLLDGLWTHAQWCRHLQARGCLSPQHRRCTQSDYCIAHWALPTGDVWRYKRAQ